MIYNKVMVLILEQFNSIESVVSLLSASNVFAVLTPIALLIGAGIGVIGSVLTMRKHLRV